MEKRRIDLAKLEKFKYPLLILVLGVVLMLLPGGSREEPAGEDSERLQQLLACAEGVGEVRVLVSEQGVVVVCSGAEDARVRLHILKAVSAYTGTGSDRITILKMAEQP